MKKWMLLLLFSFRCGLSGAQNWQCFPDTLKHYFLNDVNYLRCSYNYGDAYPDATYYYSFCTLRGPTASLSGANFPMEDGANWLGDSTTMLNDGTYMFHTMTFDTVIIKTRANVGDSWWFYNDAGIYSYKATVTAVDTSTVLGLLDSLKTIQISAYLSGVSDTSDPLNSYQIKLGKASGFVQTFDMYTFPYKFPPHTVYFYDAVGSYPADQIFHLISYHNPTLLEVYDFTPGDIFERETDHTNSWMTPCEGHDTYYSLFIDSVIAKIPIDASHIKYAIHHTGYASLTTVISYDQIDTLLVTDAGLYTNDIPESCPDYMGYYYYPNDTNWCYHSAVHAAYGPYTCGIDYFPGCLGEDVYKEGFGNVIRVEAINGSPGCDEMTVSTRTDRIIFAYKNGDSCGHYKPLYPESHVAISNQSPIAQEIRINPNPATSLISLSSSERITTVTVYNLFGQTLYDENVNSDKVQIDVSTFPAGIYLIRINGTEVRRFVKE